MKPRPDVPAETRRLQTEASDPGNSAWVSAHAGSGKTHVLVLRVIRLLLAGTDPSKILCLTYTRAAASVMANRVFRDLSAWTMLDDAVLAERIMEVEGALPSPPKLRRARRLFAEALDTPGGLKIQTIHAFCEAILHKFPLEANIAGHFDMLDPEMEAALFAEARRDMISGTTEAENRALNEAFAAILSRAGEFGLELVLTEIVGRREELRAFIAASGPETLREEFGFTPDETAAGIASSIWPVPGFSPARLAELTGLAQRHLAAQTLDKLLEPAAVAFAETDPERRLKLLRGAFFKADGDLYKPTIFKKALTNAVPGLYDDYEAAARAIEAVADRHALFGMVEASQAVMVVADALTGRYERLKRARGMLDFNDLITRTVNLLARQDAGPWVQYKLDQGIDHILIDEAQDTSPKQWRVVRSLAEEFFAGLGTRDGVTRTIFAVGDEKQSIYSFQGADPAAFAETKHAFRIRVEAAESRFQDLRLNRSFRSTDDVLAAVDRVFADPGVRQGLTRDPEAIEHTGVRPGEPGSVEVWPTLGAGQVDEPEDWTTPVNEASAPAIRVAEKVADAIQRLVRADAPGGAVRPGGIMVLVRKRDRFVHALARGLKERGIPVAGADRLSLSAHIAVQDMMALGRFCLLPEDDLSLAAILRSPIFGLTDQQLFELAAGRPATRSLAASLRIAADKDLILRGVVEQLDNWATASAFKPVFEFYAGVLGTDRVRRKMVARLGPDAGDILDEFLNFCLAQERVGLPGLEAFLATLETAAPEIKREMDQTRDEVRIMTVHASKGMEAPVVFLVDGGQAPFVDQHLPRLIPHDFQNTQPPVRGFLWRAGADLSNTVSQGIAAQLRVRAEEEYRRLLYVGMTRAEDRLIVCGYHGKRTPSPGAWHSIVTAALGGAAEIQTTTDPETGEPTLLFRVTKAVGVDGAGSPSEAARQRTLLPAELERDPPPAEDLPRPLTPSGASVLIDEGKEAMVSGRSPVLDDGGRAAFAATRGTAVHRLLQVLPSLAEGREAAAARYLERVGRDWPALERQSVQDSVRRILDDPRFAPLFAEGSRAEVEIMGTLTVKGRERAVSGKIDRLAVTPERVLIADFKTSRPPPADLSEAPEAYVLQLALYRALLQKVYPDRTVEAALVFTEAPSLMPVPPGRMDAALARLTRA